MSEQDLEQLVEKIVMRVLQRIQGDEELAKLLKTDDSAGQEIWARTCSSYRNEAAIDKTKEGRQTSFTSPTKKLYTESDILEFAKTGQKSLVVARKTLITPAARDAAKRKGIDIKFD